MYFDRAALDVEKGVCNQVENRGKVLRDWNITLCRDNTSWQVSSKLVVKLQGVSHNSVVSPSQTGWAKTGSKEKYGPVQL